MRIGQIEVTGIARLAPMAGISNAPFRLIAKECGSGLTTSEEIDCDGLLRGAGKTQNIASYFPAERPLALQLLGADPAAMAEAASVLAGQGADIIDVNMGCPVKKIVNKGKGAALMRDVDNVRAVVRAMVDAVDVPVTVKIRGGWDDHHLNAVEVALAAQDSGASAITVHPRTRSQKFTGKAPWQIIRDVVEAVDVPVTGNGDVKSMDDARRMMAETGCAHVMIGRGALGRPWLFDPGYPVLGPDVQWEYKTRVVERHVALILEYFHGRYAHTQMKTHLAWYSGGARNSRHYRRALFETKTVDETWDVFNQYWYSVRESGVTHDEPVVPVGMSAAG